MPRSYDPLFEDVEEIYLGDVFSDGKRVGYVPDTPPQEPAPAPVRMVEFGGRRMTLNPEISAKMPEPLWECCAALLLRIMENPLYNTHDKAVARFAYKLGRNTNPTNSIGRVRWLLRDYNQDAWFSA